tara:strand:- start:854 stop:976 length:123 start_codon:yes stop_codon:yes gene_type:complete
MHRSEQFSLRYGKLLLLADIPGFINDIELGRAVLSLLRFS